MVEEGANAVLGASVISRIDMTVREILAIGDLTHARPLAAPSGLFRPPQLGHDDGMPIRSRRWPLLALVALAGCSHGDAVEGPVALGQTALVGGPRVRPDHVVEDSRCPLGSRCVWAGRVVVRATVSGGDWAKTVDLVLGVPVDIADGKLALTAVTPERTERTSAKTTPSRFTFAFQGGL